MKCQLLLVILFAFCSIVASVHDSHAQDTVAGIVTDAESGEVLIGVNVRVEETTWGTVTDVSGRFEIALPTSTATLRLTYIGYRPLTVKVEMGDSLNVAMEPDIQMLEDVVVTALQVERERRSLGYSVQRVSGEDVASASETNLIDALSGQVAGASITSGVSGKGSTTRIVLRGETSIVGDNQPLFVVDGVPISNRSISSSASGGVVDFGSGALDIAPQNIASVDVLKGATAAALYGSRAANGAVIIQTKRGRESQGLGIEFSSRTMAEDILIMPQYQNEYGSGGPEAVSALGYIIPALGWGPHVDEYDVLPQFDSPTENGFRAGDIYGPGGNTDLQRRGAVIPTPFEANPGAQRDFFNTGLSFNNNLAISQALDRGGLRFSVSDLRSTGILPNTDFSRTSFGLRSNYGISDRLQVSGGVDYTITGSDNRVTSTYATNTPMYWFSWTDPTISVTALRDYWAADNEGTQNLTWFSGLIDNPYFTMFESTNGFNRDRIIGNVEAQVQVSDELSVAVGSSIDYWNEKREFRRPFSARFAQSGEFREDAITAREVNAQGRINYSRAVSDDFTLTALVGANVRSERFESTSVRAPRLVIPNTFLLSNVDGQVTAGQNASRKQVNSLFSRAELAYRNMIFVEATGRNDWSSSLPTQNNSYFYPSLSLSAVWTDLLDISPEGTLSFGRVRGSIAQVGSDAPAHRLRNTFNFGSSFRGNPRVSESSVINNPNLLPEIVTSYETGVDVGLFNNRFNIDGTYYYTNSRNQIFDVSVSSASGYSGRFVNAGRITSQGVELTVNATPIQTNNFSWDLRLNYARDRSIVQSLPEGVDSFTLQSIGSETNSRPAIILKEGERVGTMYGRGLLRHEGQIVWRDGFPVRDNELRPIGNYNPDWKGGIFNRLSLADFELSFLFDFNVGGEFVSFTLAQATNNGTLKETLRGREDGIIGEGVKEVFDADGNVVDYEENDVRISAQDYFNSRFDRPVNEELVYDASFVKLRQLRLAYNLPQNILGRLGLQDGSIAVSGRNLLLWTENPHYDPELLSFGGSQVVPGFEFFGLPSTREYGLELTLAF